MSDRSNVGTRSVTDPLALRALAHPVRLRLHRLVALEGTLTAAEAARRLDISHALASHHLRQLAKYGFVEQAEAPDERARPWRVTSTSYAPDAVRHDVREADQELQVLAARRAAEELADWQRSGSGDEPAAGGAWSGVLYLTDDEQAQLMRSWTELVMPLVDARPIGHPERRPPDAHPIAITLVRTPIEPGGADPAQDDSSLQGGDAEARGRG